MARFSQLAVVLVLGFAVVGLGVAQPGPGAKVDPYGPITDVRLGELLDGLGVEPAKEVGRSGNYVYDVEVATPEYDFPIRVCLSGSGRVVWLVVGLAELPEEIPPDRLRAVLEAVHVGTGKVQFRLAGDHFAAYLPLDNVAMSPVRLRRGLDDLVNVLLETRHLWDPAKWEKRA